MIELLFVACLSVTSQICEEKSMMFMDVSMQTCMLRAQGELARWTAAHPRWTIQRWSCRDAGSTEQNA